MKKRIVQVLCTACALFVLLSGQIEAVAHKPVISGNYEQGWRLYESEEGNGDDYFFQEGWLKWKQDLSTQSYYYVRLQYQANNFSTDDKWDSKTVDLLMNYTQQISKPIRLRTEVNLRNKIYPNDQLKADGTTDTTILEKDYYAMRGDVELTVKPWTGDIFYYSVKLQYDLYPNNTKENLLAGMNLRWEHKVSKELKLHTACNLTKEEYLYNSSSDKTRYSISVGFEYQL
jgi:hypothetical protein